MEPMTRFLFRSTLYILLVSAWRAADAGRAARSLAFQKGSSFFYRFNYKINSLPNTKIFAQAAGFKAAWEIPAGPVLGAGRIGRSVAELREHAELVYESHGFDGNACLLKNFCQALEYARRKRGVVAKILKLLAGSYINNATSHDGPLFCEQRARNCPLELLGMNGVADG